MIAVRELALYLHFFVALATGCFAAIPGAFPGLFILGLPGTNENLITMDLVALGAVPGTGAAALTFWAAGHPEPLRASVLVTVLAAVAALAMFLALVQLAANTVWLSGNDVLIVMLGLLATVGYLPFRFADRT